MFNLWSCLIYIHIHTLHRHGSLNAVHVDRQYKSQLMGTVVLLCQRIPLRDAGNRADDFVMKKNALFERFARGDAAGRIVFRFVDSRRLCTTPTPSCRPSHTKNLVGTKHETEVKSYDKHPRLLFLYNTPKISYGGYWGTRMISITSRFR